MVFGRKAIEVAPPAPVAAADGDAEAFVRELLRTGYDVVQAARVAKYPSPAIAGPKLMRLPEIQALIKTIEKQDRIAADMTPERLKQAVMRTIEYDLTDLIDPATNAPRPLHELPVEIRKNIESIELKPDGTFKIKTAKKNAAQALAASIMGMGTTTVNHTGTVDHRVNLDSLTREELDLLIDAAPIDAEFEEAK